MTFKKLKEIVGHIQKIKLNPIPRLKIKRNFASCKGNFILRPKIKESFISVFKK